MDPGRHIYLSNSKNNFGQKWFLNEIKKISRKKHFLQKNILEKQNLGTNNFLLLPIIVNSTI